MVAYILKGKTVHPDVSLSIAPGSKQVFNMLAQNGALADLIEQAHVFWKAHAVLASAWVNHQIQTVFLCVPLTVTLKDVPVPLADKYIW